MSQQRVETVRRIYERWGRGDFRAGVELYDPQVLLVLRSPFPEAGTYLGAAEIRKYMRDLLANLADLAISGDEFLDAGDSVVVRVEQRGIGPESGAAVALGYYQVWTFRGDSVIRLESIRERAEALAAAGLTA